MSGDIASGLFFNDITDHLSCFISIKCENDITKNNRMLTKVFGDKHCKRFIENKCFEGKYVIVDQDIVNQMNM